MTKPGDHPDFFRFPPPPGRSRESTIRLDGDGRFWHDDEPVQHAPMAAAFARWIDRHPDDGRFILSNGYDWTYFRVDDVPFFVTAVSGDEGELRLTITDGTVEPLDPSTVCTGPREALYCRVKAGRFEARFQPSAQAALGPWLAEGVDGVPCLAVGGSRHPIRVRGQEA